MSKYVRWRIKSDKGGLIWVWDSDKFRIWSEEIDKIHEFLVQHVSPGDDLIYAGFKDEDITIKGKKFLEEYHVKALPGNR